MILIFSLCILFTVITRHRKIFGYQKMYSVKLCIHREKNGLSWVSRKLPGMFGFWSAPWAVLNQLIIIQQPLSSPRNGKNTWWCLNCGDTASLFWFYQLLTMSMTIFLNDCLCFLVKFWKMSQFSSWSNLKPTAKWWFSKTEESLYIKASSES